MIRVLDKNLKFVDYLRKYTFAQYTKEFRGLGNFTINIRLERENLYLLDKKEQYFVLFESKDFGIIEKIEKQSDSEYERVATISGRMANALLTKRIVYRTLKYKGYTVGFVEELIKSNLINSPDARRNMNIILTRKHESLLMSVCSAVNKTVTGGYVWEAVSTMLELDKLGIDVIPHIIPGDGVNIKEWEIIISPGIDRTKGNKRGNPVVVFSQSLSNIKQTEYRIDTQNYCNVAYIAGEGEGEERKWYEKDINKGNEKGETGWLRTELWIDARDIQSEDAEGNVISESEYEQLIDNRVNEKADEATGLEEYDSAVIQENKLYIYGKDYAIGDFVTVIDDELGITVDAQITSITISETGENSQRIYDIGLTYGKIRKSVVQSFAKTKQSVQENTNSIKYLEGVVNKLKREGVSGGGEVTGALYMFEIRDDNLFMIYQSGVTPPNYEIRDDGHLYAAI